MVEGGVFDIEFGAEAAGAELIVDEVIANEEMFLLFLELHLIGKIEVSLECFAKRLVVDEEFNHCRTRLFNQKLLANLSNDLAPKWNKVR